MATSNSENLATTGRELVLTAYNILGHYGFDVANINSAASETYALRLLNWYMKHIQSHSSFLWKKSTAYIFVQADKYSYISGTDHITESYVTTLTTAAASASGTTLTVSSTTGMTTGDQILIPKADDTYQNTTVTVASSTSLTLGTGLAEALASGSRIYTYTSKIGKPFRVFKVYRREHTSTSYSDIPIDMVSYDDYQADTSDKTSTSGILEVAYLPRRLTGTFFVSKETNSLNHIAAVTYEKVIEDIDTVATDEPDFPADFFLPLAYKLAYYLAFTLRFPPAIRQEIGIEADRLIKQACDGNMEMAPVDFMVGRR